MCLYKIISRAESPRGEFIQTPSPCGITILHPSSSGFNVNYCEIFLSRKNVIAIRILTYIYYIYQLWTFDEVNTLYIDLFRLY